MAYFYPAYLQRWIARLATASSLASSSAANWVVAREHGADCGCLVDHSKQRLVPDLDWGHLACVSVEMFGMAVSIRYETETFALGLENQRMTVGGDC